MPRYLLTEEQLQAIQRDLVQLQLDEAIGKARRAKYIELLKKHRPDLDPEKVVDALEDYGSSKAEKVGFQWTIKGKMDPFTDKEKVQHALKVAGNKKVDPLQYDGPAALLDAFAGQIKAPPIDPDSYPYFLLNKQALSHGITVYDVTEDDGARVACREIINTHFGEDANPWCLLQSYGDGHLTPQSAEYWYDHYPGKKRIAFQDGKLVAFYADERWWDRTDNPTDGIPLVMAVPNDPLNRKMEALYYPDTDETSPMSDYYRGNKQNGTYEEWFSDNPDQMKLRANYKGGRRVGKYERWYVNGHLAKAENYDEKGRMQGLQRTYYKNGQLSSEATYESPDPYSICAQRVGLSRTWYDDGQLSTEATYAVDPDDSRSTKRVGVSRKWHPNGQLEAEEHYSADTPGDLDGLTRRWNSNGVLIRRESYKNDVKDGVFEIWSPDGKLIERSRFVKGLQQGLHENWYENGQMSSRITYRAHEKNGRFERWYENGQRLIRASFKDGQLDGVVENWYANGQMSSRITYRADKRKGRFERWYENGQKHEDYTADDDVSTGCVGRYMAWYPNGNVMTDNNYDDEGQPDGENRDYYPNGQLRRLESVKAGSRNGVYAIYNEQGVLVQRKHYKNGALHGIEEYYRDDGSKVSETTYRNSVRHGPSKVWYPNGQRTEEVKYADGYPVSEQKWDENGVLVRSATFHDSSQAEKTVKEWHSDGSLRLLAEYDKSGKAVKEETYPPGTVDPAPSHSGDVERRTYKTDNWEELQGKLEIHGNVTATPDGQLDRAARSAKYGIADAAYRIESDIFDDREKDGYGGLVHIVDDAAGECFDRVLKSFSSQIEALKAQDAMVSFYEPYHKWAHEVLPKAKSAADAREGFERAMRGVLDEARAKIDASKTTAMALDRKEQRWLRNAARRHKITPTAYAAANVKELWAETAAYTAKRGKQASDALKKLIVKTLSGLDKTTAMESLLETVDAQKLFSKLGSAQRGAPEKAMLRVQRVMGGGVLNPVVEHVGDLTHRMTEWVDYTSAGYDNVSDKVDRVLRALTDAYGFEREMEENIVSNARYDKVPVAEFRKRLYAALDKYADAHRKLPVYNEVQRLARDAAVYVGERRFDKAVANLRRLKKYLDEGREAWKQRATAYNENVTEGGMGSNPPETGRKRDLITRIQIQWAADKKPMEQIKKDTAGLKRKTVAELEDYYRQMFESVLCEHYHSDNPMSRDWGPPPPARLKAVFLAPAHIHAGKAALESFAYAGFKTIRQGLVNRFLDVAERTPQGDYWNTRARQVELAEMKAAARGRVPVVIDVREVRNLDRAKQQLERAGYDCYYVPIGPEVCKDAAVREAIQLFGKKNTVAIEDTAESVASFVRAGTRRAIREIMRRPVYNWRARLLWESIPGFERWVYYNGKIVTVTTDHHYGMLRVDPDLKKSGATWEDAVRVYKFEQRTDPKLRKKFRGLVRLGKFQDRISAIFDGWPQHPPKKTVKRVLTALQNFTEIRVSDYDVQVMWMDGGKLYPAKTRKVVKESGDGLPYFLEPVFGTELVELFRNPSSTKVKRIASHDVARALLLPKVALVWDGLRLLHRAAQRSLPAKYQNIAIPVTYYVGSNAVHVTDSAKVTKWYRNKATADAILTHPWIKRMGVREVYYFDADIVGPWHELDESIDESGYDWDAGMSNNAVDAYKRRRMPASKMADYLRKSGFIKKYSELRGVTALDIAVAVDPDEWHHTSKRFNKTDFYWLRDVLKNRDVIAQLIPLRKRLQRAVKKSNGRLPVPMPEDPNMVWYYIGDDIPGASIFDALHKWISGLSGHKQAIEKALQQVSESKDVQHDPETERILDSAEKFLTTV